MFPDARGDSVDTTTAIAHRLRQARALALRAELAMTIAQILFWVSLIGVAVGLAAWAHRRLSRGEPQDGSEAAASASQSAEWSAPEAGGEIPSAPQR